MENTVIKIEAVTLEPKLVCCRLSEPERNQFYRPFDVFGGEGAKPVAPFPGHMDSVIYFEGDYPGVSRSFRDDIDIRVNNRWQFFRGTIEELEELVRDALNTVRAKGYNIKSGICECREEDRWFFYFKNELLYSMRCINIGEFMAYEVTNGIAGTTSSLDFEVDERGDVTIVAADMNDNTRPKLIRGIKVKDACEIIRNFLTETVIREKERTVLIRNVLPSEYPLSVTYSIQPLRDTESLSENDDTNNPMRAYVQLFSGGKRVKTRGF